MDKVELDAVQIILESREFRHVRDVCDAVRGVTDHQVVSVFIDRSWHNVRVMVRFDTPDGEYDCVGHWSPEAPE